MAGPFVEEQPLKLYFIPFPGVTNLARVRVYEANSLLKAPVEEFVEQFPPDCIIADFLYKWVDNLANKLHIPILSFNGFSPLCSSFCFLLRHSRFPSPYITMNTTPPTELTVFLEQLRELELRSYGLIVSNFAELDGEEDVEHYEKTTGHKAWHLGPGTLISKSDQERGQKRVVRVHECLTWLNTTQSPNSVIYICFRSFCLFGDEQLYEIACGIEASCHDFIWVVHEKKGEKENKSIEDKEKVGASRV